MNARRRYPAASAGSRSVAVPSAVIAAFQSASRKLRWKDR